MSNLALQFDLTARREKNLRVLQSVDDSVIEIIEDYSHVAVYEFEAASKTWERLDVEGSLFITRSLTEPFYSLIVLNKKGPSDFALDLSTVLKLSLQKPYLMLRCSTPAEPIVFGVWSHNESELESIHAMLDRISIKKEKPAAPPSPQAKASQLLSMLKPKKSGGTAATAATGAMSPTATTMAISAAAVVAPPSSTTAPAGSSTAAGAVSGAPQPGSAAAVGGALNKAAALLSALKVGSAIKEKAPEREEENSPVQNILVPASDSSASNKSSANVKSAQLLSLLKSPTAAGGSQKITQAAPATAGSTSRGKQAVTVEVHIPPAPQAPPAQQRGPVDDARRAELMLKMIKPRTVSVDDLLTDVDIAAKVKASTTSAPTTVPALVPPPPAPTPTPAPVPAPTPTSSSVYAVNRRTDVGEVAPGTESKVVATSSPSSSSAGVGSREEMLLRLYSQNLTPIAGTAGVSTPAATKTSTVPIAAGRLSPVGTGLPPRHADRNLAGSPPATGSLATATALFSQQGSSTQRSSEALTAALRGNGGSTRSVQRSPSASPVLTGMPGPSGLATPISWASLSNNNIAGSATPVAPAVGLVHSASTGNVAGAAVAPAAVRQALPMLISPSDLRSMPAASTR